MMMMMVIAAGNPVPQMVRMYDDGEVMMSGRLCRADDVEMMMRTGDVELLMSTDDGKMVIPSC
jgi:hypothetical protein